MREGRKRVVMKGGGGKREVKGKREVRMRCKRVWTEGGRRAVRKDEGRRGEGRKGVVGQTEGGEEGSEW